MSTIDKQPIKQALSNELRQLVLETWKQTVFALPESVECAMRDWRYADVTRLLQQKCDELTDEYYNEFEQMRVTEPTTVVGWFHEYIWLQGLHLKWKRLEGRFASCSLKFPIQR